MRRAFVFALLLGLIALAAAMAADEPGVPAAFQPLFTELSTKLDEVASYLDTTQAPPPAAFKTVFAELLIATGYRGEKLFDPGLLVVLDLTLDRLRSLGVRGVSITVPFPLLATNYFDQSRYRDFYKTLIASARQRGFVVQIKMATLYDDPLWREPRAEIMKLDNAALIARLHDMAAAILHNLQPDYLTIFNEPDAASANLGRTITPELYQQILQGTLAGLDRGATRLGAGAGTWSPLAFFAAAAQTPGLDYLDLHILPIQQDWATGQIARIAALAQAGGKRLAIGECWLLKASTQDQTDVNVSNWSRFHARGAFSFWAPLDVRFQEAVLRLGARHNLEFVSFLMTPYFYAYLDFEPAFAKWQPDAIMHRVNDAVAENMYSSRLSPFGQNLRKLIAR